MQFVGSMHLSALCSTSSTLFWSYGWMKCCTRLFDGVLLREDQELGHLAVPLGHIPLDVDAEDRRVRGVDELGEVVGEPLLVLVISWIAVMSARRRSRP